MLHLSAHFVDGHYDLQTNGWRDGKSPIPFTRDFGELLGAYEFQAGSAEEFWGSVHVMIYLGIGYAAKVRPDELRRTSFVQGLEIRTSDPLGTFFGKPWNIYLAYNFSLTGIPGYIGSKNIESGIKLGEWSGTGIRIYLSYYNGLDVFSQYFNIRREHWGVGFTFDFW